MIIVGVGVVKSIKNVMVNNRNDRTVVKLA